MALPDTCYMNLPCSDEDLQSLFRQAETNKWTKLVVTYRTSLLIYTPRYHPFYQVQQLIRLRSSSWKELTLDWSRGSIYMVHCHDLATVLDSAEQFDSLTLKNMDLDGTHIATFQLSQRLRPLTSITFTQVRRFIFSEAQLERLTQEFHSPTLRLDGCPWATDNLEWMRNKRMEDLQLREVTAAKMMPLIAYLKVYGCVLKRLELRFVEDDDFDETAEFMNELAVALKRNRSLESLTMEFRGTRLILPVIEACRAGNKGLKTLSIVFLGLFLEPNAIWPLLTSVMKVNTTLENITMQHQLAWMHQRFVVMDMPSEVTHCLELNRLGRHKLLRDHGKNDHEWITTLVNMDTSGTSSAFWLLNENPGAFFGQENREQLSIGDNDQSPRKKRRCTIDTSVHKPTGLSSTCTIQ